MFGVINGAIATTIIDGKVRMEERKVLGINEKTISDKCQQLAEQVWNRIL